jgi:tetratricopeptide (TPR) repeat protein
VFLLAALLLSRATASTDPPKHKVPPEAVLASGITALLFGIHPLHVESVAWVAERKDLLCGFFFLLSLLSYLNYCSSGIRKTHYFYYGLTILLFMLALMSKPMAVSLPLILLLLDMYPLKRLGKSLTSNLFIFLEKIPFFVLSIASSTLTIIAQHRGGSIHTLEQVTLGARLLNALWALLFYLKKIIFPFKLIPFYPFAVHPTSTYLLSGALIVAIILLSIWMVKRRHYFFLSLWLYYGITLFPVLGILQVGGQGAADRYTYLPGIGPFLLMGIGLAWIWYKISMIGIKMITTSLKIVIPAFMLFTLSSLTIRQIEVWKNSEILWKYVIATSSTLIPVAYNNLGIFYARTGDYPQAISEYKKAIKVSPYYAEAHNNLGIVYARENRYRKAISEYKKAIALKPNYAKAYNNLAVAHYHTHNYRVAVQYCDKALELGYGVHPEFLKLLLPYR